MAGVAELVKAEAPRQADLGPSPARLAAEGGPAEGSALLPDEQEPVGFLLGVPVEVALHLDVQEGWEEEVRLPAADFVSPSTRRPVVSSGAASRTLTARGSRVTSGRRRAAYSSGRMGP